jgi:hypothetical protein
MDIFGGGMMKHWGNWKKITGCLFVMALVSLQVQAATDKFDREFNHRTSGYPLTGVHAMAACETCHVGGVFLGTPRVCDGCHAVGKRIVATPKSAKHIVTDAPCDSCHFNTSTFFGARYNHGTAVPGQCTNCHNGRIVEGTPRNHPVSSAAGTSCDSCHRSSSWIPASWNHRDTSSDCSVCHQAAGPGRSYNVASHLPMSMPPATFTGNCMACHTNYYTFLSAFYNHSGAGSSCQNCHGSGGSPLGGTTYTGVRAAGTAGAQSVHAAIGSAPFGAATCQSCHKSIATFMGARYDHVGAGTACDTCHGSGSPSFGGYIQVASTARHTVYANVGIATCSSCHTNTAAWTGSRYDHAGATVCADCHVDANKPWIPSSMSSPPHIPTTATCESCHNTSGTTWSMAVTSVQLHNFVTTSPCKTCHLSGNPYAGNGQTTKEYGHKHMNTSQDCISCHATQYNRWNHP